jgi:hypothetical protein
MSSLVPTELLLRVLDIPIHLDQAHENYRREHHLGLNDSQILDFTYFSLIP